MTDNLSAIFKAPVITKHRLQLNNSVKFSHNEENGNIYNINEDHLIYDGNQQLIDLSSSVFGHNDEQRKGKQ